jgi:hypothetical protein
MEINMKTILALLLATAAVGAQAQNTLFNSPSNGYQGGAQQHIQTPQGRYVPTYDGMTGNQELAGRNYGSGQVVAPAWTPPINNVAPLGNGTFGNNPQQNSHDQSSFGLR